MKSETDGILDCTTGNMLLLKKIPLQIRQGEQVLAPSATFVLYRNFVLITDTM